MSRDGAGGFVVSKFRAVLRGWRWIIVGILSTLTPAVIVSLLSPPMYRAQATLSVQLNDPEETLAGQVAVLEGDAVYERVRDQLGVSEAPPRAEGLLGSDPDELIVRVESRDAITSTILANGFATAYAEQAAGGVAVQPAEPPDGPFTRPRWVTWLIALAAGTALGSLAALWIDWRGRSVIGRIPSYPMPDSHPIMLRDPNGRVADAYRRLRDNIENFDLRQPPQVIVVTGVGAGLGVTTTAVNLALAYVQFGLRVVLIDANLRSPHLHEIFGFGGSPGLVDNLADATVESTMRAVADGLFVIPAGATPSNPLEVLSRRRMDDVIEEIRDGFELIVIDAPPVLDGGDAGLLARHADAVLTVARPRNARRRELRRVEEKLNRVRAPSFGLVMNCDPHAARRGQPKTRPLT